MKGGRVNKNMELLFSSKIRVRDLIMWQSIIMNMKGSGN